MKRTILILLMLAGCGPAPETAEGCPILISEYGQAYTAACIRAFYEEQARLQGKPVTRCFGGPGSMSCTTQ